MRVIKINESNNIQQITSAKSDEIFLTDIKYWRNRIKFDNPLVFFSFFVFYLFFWVIPNFILAGLDYIITFAFIYDIFGLSLVLLTLFISRKLPSQFQKFINSNINIFKSEEIFSNYKDYVKDYKYKSLLDL